MICHLVLTYDLQPISGCKTRPNKGDSIRTIDVKPAREVVARGSPKIIIIVGTVHRIDPDLKAYCIAVFTIGRNIWTAIFLQEDLDTRGLTVMLTNHGKGSRTKLPLN